MTNNPLIDKYFELYPEKKEEPKKLEYELPEDFKTKLAELDFKTKLAELRNTSTIPSVALPNAPNYITASNASVTINPKPPKLVSYDPHSAEGYFLEVAEKIKNKDAKVTSVGIERDCVGVFSTGMQTITFEVMLYDTP